MTAEGHPLKSRVIGIIKLLNRGMHEREEIIAVSLLAALAGQNTFLLGPPGTAKSLIARRIACSFSEKAYFGYLMQRFSTPEEIFGPVSIKELKEDNYVRKTEGFLPRADFAFLDEIWKAGPAILNALLTIINEKIFRNGVSENKVPLKALIAASNETPPKEVGLEALYDRFIVRLYVPPMQGNDNFVSLLQSPPANADVGVQSGLAVGNAEWDKWQENIGNVEISDDTIEVVQLIKKKLADTKNKKLEAYISDRRWQKAMLIVKAAAFFCERDKTNLADTLLLRHCLWDTDKNREAIIKIVEDAVKASGLSTGQNFSEMFSHKEDLSLEIKDALFYDKDVYATQETQNGVKCYVVGVVHDYHSNSPENLYIPVSGLATKDEFHPFNNEGNELDNFVCKAAGKHSFNIKATHSNRTRIRLVNAAQWKESLTWQPKVLYKEGTGKECYTPDARQRLVTGYRVSIRQCKDGFCAIENDVEERLKEFERELDSPFVPTEKCDIALQGVHKQLDEIKEAIQDCEDLNELAKD